jgi:hypothetical protein
VVLFFRVNSPKVRRFLSCYDIEIVAFDNLSRGIGFEGSLVDLGSSRISCIYEYSFSTLLAREVLSDTCHRFYLSAGVIPVQTTAIESDSELKAAIEKHTWYSGRHGYRFLSNGVIAIDGYPTEERWSIQNGLLHREWEDGQTGTTKILAITDRQFAEEEVSSRSKGTVTIMSSGNPNR